MKKKRPLHGQPSKKIKKSVTGIEEQMAQFFVGSERKIAGFMHLVFGPRLTEEYEKMRVTDLVRRIKDDLRELLARAYPTSKEEWWQQRFVLKYRPEWGTTYESRLRYRINQSVAEELCRDLGKRITSPDKIVNYKAHEEYQRLLSQFLEREPRYAAVWFAFIAKQAASYLEYLSDKRGTLMKEIAAKSDLWPVNLGLRIKRVKGKPAYQVTRQAFARNYLIQLGLSSHCVFPSSPRSGAESISPFKLAAEELYLTMLELKEEGPRRFYFPKLTSWAKRLFALKVPMTKRNSQDWWKVAKFYLYERWDKAQGEFKPLIKHLGFEYPIQLSSKIPYESMVKSRVIDNDLKDAFFGLARPDL